MHIRGEIHSQLNRNSDGKEHINLWPFELRKMSATRNFMLVCIMLALVLVSMNVVGAFGKRLLVINFTQFSNNYSLLNFLS